MEHACWSSTRHFLTILFLESVVSGDPKPLSPCWVQSRLDDKAEFACLKAFDGACCAVIGYLTAHVRTREQTYIYILFIPRKLCHRASQPAGYLSTWVIW